MCHRAKRGSVVNRDPLEERGGWTLYEYLQQGTYNPFFSSGLEETSFITEWKQSQDTLLRNTSLPHSNEEIQFGSRRNSTLAEGVEKDKKYYSANAEKGRNQGGSGGLEFDSLPVFGGLPSAGNGDINLYIFVGNNPVNAYDILGLDKETTFNWMQETGDNILGVNKFAYEENIVAWEVVSRDYPGHENDQLFNEKDSFGPFEVTRVTEETGDLIEGSGRPPPDKMITTTITPVAVDPNMRVEDMISLANPIPSNPGPSTFESTRTIEIANNETGNVKTKTVNGTVTENYVHKETSLREKENGGISRTSDEAVEEYKQKLGARKKHEEESHRWR